MRVLETSTGRFVDIDPRKTKYAILSHTWDQSGEQTYQDVLLLQQSIASRTGSLFVSARQRASWLFLSMPAHLFHIVWGAIITNHLTTSLFLRMEGERRKALAVQLQLWVGWLTDTLRAFGTPISILDDPRLAHKIRRACAIARAHGFRYIWVDSCCIDKTSSSELSEAINSMFLWYRAAVVCYSFLADVPDDEDPRAQESLFRQSRWFRRGWTLQELIAPRVVVFLSAGWNILGTKSTLTAVVEEVTGIEREILTHQRSLAEVSVARRMSWASERETTRVEDRAYSLMGIFDINMPTLYGEGERAFTRLQEEILKRVPDQSLFAWGKLYLEPLPTPQLRPYDPPLTDPRRFTFEYSQSSLLASSPSDFRYARNITAVARDDFLRRLSLEDEFPECAPSPYGVRTRLPLMSIVRWLPWDSVEIDGETRQLWYLAVLACEDSRRAGHLLGRICYAEPSQSDLTVRLLDGTIGISMSTSPASVSASGPKLVILSPSRVANSRPWDSLIKTVYMRNVEPPPIHADQAFFDYPLSSVDGHARVPLTLSEWTKATLQAQGYEVFCGAISSAPHARAYHVILANTASTVRIKYDSRPALSLSSDATVHIAISAHLHDLAQHKNRTSVGAAQAEWEIQASDEHTELPPFVFESAAEGVVSIHITLENILRPWAQMGIEIRQINQEVENAPHDGNEGGHA